MQRITLGVGVLLAAMVVTSVATAQKSGNTGLSRKSATATCLALVKVEEGIEKAKQLQEKLGPNTPFRQLARKEGSYLPAGFPQTNSGHDTCRMTGVGYYLDTNDLKQFNACDPEGPRLFTVTCNRNRPVSAKFCPADGGGGNGCPKVSGNEKERTEQIKKLGEPFDPRTTRPCEGGYKGSRAAAGVELYKSPTCEKRLSNFKVDNYFLACDDTSVTYATCKRRLSGTWEHQDKSSTGSFCALPQGKKVVDQLSKYNDKKYKEMQAATGKMAADLAKAKQKIMKKVRKYQIECGQRGRAISHL